jgi:hypothetical protein
MGETVRLNMCLRLRAAAVVVKNIWWNLVEFGEVVDIESDVGFCL